MGRTAGQSAYHIGKKQGETELGIFKPDLHYKAATDELHQYLPFSGESGTKLAGYYKRKQNKLSEFSIPGLEGGLLLKRVPKIMIRENEIHKFRNINLYRTTMNYIFKNYGDMRLQYLIQEF